MAEANWASGTFVPILRLPFWRSAESRHAQVVSHKPLMAIVEGLNSGGTQRA
jgi:hypothetical protein